MVAEIIEAPNGLTPAEKRHLTALERRIERGLSTFREVGEALLEIRDQRLYRLVAPTFEVYCRDRWSMERNRAYQLMGAAEVAQALPDGAHIVNEAQARELTPLLHASPDLLPEVWRKVSDGESPITAPRIRAAVREVTGTPEVAQATSPTRLLVALIERAANDYVKWRELSPTREERQAVRAALDRLTSVAAR